MRRFPRRPDMCLVSCVRPLGVPCCSWWMCTSGISANRSGTSIRGWILELYNLREYKNSSKNPYQIERHSALLHIRRLSEESKAIIFQRTRQRCTSVRVHHHDQRWWGSRAKRYIVRWGAGAQPQFGFAAQPFGRRSTGGEWWHTAGGRSGRRQGRIDVHLGGGNCRHGFAG